MPINESQPASKYFEILSHLSETEWENLSEVATAVRMNNTTLKNIMNIFEQREFVKSWDSLTEDQKKIEKKNSIKDFKEGSKFFKITPLGKKKIDNIKEICLDEEDQVLLKFRLKWVN